LRAGAERSAKEIFERKLDDESDALHWAPHFLIILLVAHFDSCIVCASLDDGWLDRVKLPAAK
jgi:hypothetical protein